MKDSHVHLFSSDVKNNREQYFDDAAFKTLYSSAKSKIAGLEDVRDYMIQGNIEAAVVSGFCWEKEDRCRKENDNLRNISEDGVLFPFAVLPPGAMKTTSLEKYLIELKNENFAGVGELAFYKEGITSENEIFLSSVFEICSDLKLPVMLHLNEPVGHKYPGKYSPDFEKIYKLIVKYPSLRIILSHWGGGIFIYELMSEVKSAFKNVYYDTAASPYLYESKIYEIAVNSVGSGKILFGSDYPLLSEKRYLRGMSETCLRKEDILNIQSANFDLFFKE